MCEHIDSIFLKSTSKCRLKIVRPIGRNAKAKFKGTPNFLGDEIQKSRIQIQIQQLFLLRPLQSDRWRITEVS